MQTQHDTEYDDQSPEEERIWRDASAHLLRATVGRWLRDDSSRREIIKVFVHDTPPHLSRLIAILHFRIKYAKNDLIRRPTSLSSSSHLGSLRLSLRNTIATSSHSSCHLLALVPLQSSHDTNFPPGSLFSPSSPTPKLFSPRTLFTTSISLSFRTQTDRCKD